MSAATQPNHHTTTQEIEMTTTTTKLSASDVIWHGSAQGQTSFAFLDHRGHSFTLLAAGGGCGIFILLDIDGNDHTMGEVDTIAEALAFITGYAMGVPA
jgi:hypothetical protein